jgi:predicted anti-sigma-YlaC factor YlaD
MKLELDCKDVSRLLSEAQERDTPAAEQARLRLHLVVCQSCRTVEEQMAFIRRAMRKLGEDRDPPAPS